MLEPSFRRMTLTFTIANLFEENILIKIYFYIIQNQNEATKTAEFKHIFLRDL